VHAVSAGLQAAHDPIVVRFAGADALLVL